MPKFAANLSMMFNEVPFPQRFAAARAGFKAVEFLFPYEHMPGYFLQGQADAHALREEAGEPNVKVQMDFYHAQICEGDLISTFKRHIDGIGHVQIASVPARNEPDDGEINYPFLFRQLDELGYEGWVGCEYRPRGVTEDGLGWLAATTIEGAQA